MFEILVIFILLSCEKDNATPFINQSNIVVGDYSNMSFQRLDTIIIGAYWEPASFEIDIDKDSIVDFKIYSIYWGSPGMGYYSESSVVCLNNSSYININYFPDTVFLYTKIDTVNSDNETRITIYDTYSCERKYPNDSVMNIEESYCINVLNKKDSISVADSWMTDSITLIEAVRWYVCQVSETPDTTVWRQSHYYHNCHSFPNNTMAYIGIKKENSGKIKLGWIKLSISQNFIISVLEAAIQK